MEKSDYDSLEDWDVVTVSQVSETGAASKSQDKPTEATTVVTDAENGLKSPSEDESPTSTHEVVLVKPDVTMAEPENETKAILEHCDEDEPRSESESRESESKASSPEPETQILAEPADESKSEDVVAAELEVDTKISVNVEEEKSTSSENERTSESIPRETVEDIVFDTIEGESSPADNVPVSCQKPDTEDILEHLIEKISEQDLAAIESSSSDIDIIDEVMDESTFSSSMMSSPLSLSISSSVADASYMASAASQFVDIKQYYQEQKEEPTQYMGARQGLERETTTKSPDYPPEASSFQMGSKRRSSSPKKEHSRQSRETPSRQTFYDWLVLLLEFFRSMSPYDWCLVGAVSVAFYATVIFNQTNIFALVHKDDAMSQMKHMIEELKHDNKILKEQMLTEIKNEKALSSFEHQIKELRRENSRLNHMLFDVAKVLDKQKDFQDKKETEHLLAPFKKEINKLKEYINALKIDNEELQKEMVRMRYSSGQPREGRQETNEDIPLDVETLKKWNELVTLLSKELGVLELDILKGQKSGKDSFWKNLLNNFKSSYNDFRKVNLSKVFKEYRETKKKELLNIYLLAKDLVKDFFTPEEIPTADKDDPQWRGVGDFMEDLKEKWANIKDRLYASDLRKFFESSIGSKKSVDTPSKEHQTTNEQVKIRIKTYDRQDDSRSKPESTETEEESKWVFERAADREQQRERTKEEEANWFLKRGKHNTEDKGNRRL